MPKNNPLSLPPDEDGDKDALVRLIETADDFALIFVVAEPARVRPRIVEEITGRLGGAAIQRVRVTKETRNLLHLLQDVLTDPVPDVLFVDGWENVVSASAAARSHPILLNLNAARNNFYPLIPRPMVFWVAPFVLKAMAEAAPDFVSVRSGIYTFALTVDERQEMHRTVETVGQREILGMDRTLRERSIAEMESLLAEYESLPPAQQNPLDKARILDRLAIAHNTLGRHAEAEPLYDEALRIRRQSLPPGHPNIATSLNNLAFLYKSTGRYDEALPLYEEALEMFAAALEEAHPNTKTVRRNVEMFCEEMVLRAAGLTMEEAAAMSPDELMKRLGR